MRTGGQPVRWRHHRTCDPPVPGCRATAERVRLLGGPATPGRHPTGCTPAVGHRLWHPACRQPGPPARAARPGSGACAGAYGAPYPGLAPASSLAARAGGPGCQLLAEASRSGHHRYVASRRPRHAGPPALAAGRGLATTCGASMRAWRPPGQWPSPRTGGAALPSLAWQPGWPGWPWPGGRSGHHTRARATARRGPGWAGSRATAVAARATASCACGTGAWPGPSTSRSTGPVASWPRLACQQAPASPRPAATGVWPRQLPATWLAPPSPAARRARGGHHVAG